MKIYNTNQEIGCRILLILQIVKETYSIERIGYYDYFSLHFSDLKKTGESLHPSNPNHSAEIIIKRHMHSSCLPLPGVPIRCSLYHRDW